MEACNSNTSPNVASVKAEENATNNGSGPKESILTRSLKFHMTEEFILRLIRSGGCDVNESCEEDLQPLHLAVRRSSLLIAQELLNHGADVNALDDWKWTPLQYAVRSGNLEATCMLLFHGADVTVADCGNRTPLINSLDLNQEDIAEVLISYYDDFSCTSIFNATALDYALWNRSRLALDLVEAGADVNECRDGRDRPIVSSFRHYRDNALFKAMWPKLDQTLLLNNRPGFLMTYLTKCVFLTDQWLECLYLILSSSVAMDLIEECENSMSLRIPFISFLLHNLQENKVGATDRVAVINLCMSLGATVKFWDINYVLCYSNHKFNSEVQAMIYGGDINIDFLQKIIRPQAVFLLGMEEEGDSRLIYDFCKILIQVAPGPNVSKCIIGTLRNFSLPRKIRSELENLFKERFGSDAQLGEEIERIPEVPSLIELSRNSARNYLKRTHPIGKPYQFHDIVKNLQVPNRVKDFIAFKLPLY